MKAKRPEATTTIAVFGFMAETMSDAEVIAAYRKTHQPCFEDGPVEFRIRRKYNDGLVKTSREKRLWVLKTKDGLLIEKA